MRKRLSVIAITAGFALALSACGENRRDNGDQMARSGPAPDQVPPVDLDSSPPPAETMPAPKTTETPADQMAPASDVDVARQIQNSISVDSSLSPNAKSVKVIAKDGVVTLEGPVKDAKEKAAIVAIASGTQGVKRVDDHLEVTKQ
jgi:hypothetical protein